MILGDLILVVPFVQFEALVYRAIESLVVQFDRHEGRFG